MSNQEETAPAGGTARSVSRRPPPPWLFGLTSLPFGIASGFTTFAMPFMLRKMGISVERIAAIYALTMLPSAYQFIWAPLVDFRLRRRSWLILVATLGAGCIAAALLLPLPHSLTSFVALVVVGQGLVGLVGSCNGALMATLLPVPLQGRASGWFNAGNLGGGAAGAGVTLWFAQRASPSVIALILATMIILPALSALAIDEPPRLDRTVRALFTDMLRDVWRTARTRSCQTGILFCLSPVGTAAAMNLFAGIATDFRASASMVTFATGFAGGLLTAVGSLAGGWICDRIDRRLAYLLAGGLTALVGGCMAIAPLHPATYLVGSSAYLLVSGFCYAAFSAVVLEIVGGAKESAATQYTLFTAAGNQAIAYTTWLDGRAYATRGPRGLLGMDALANLGGIAFLLVILRLMKRRSSI